MKIPLRVLIPVLALLCLIILLSGCTETVPPEPPGDMVSIAEGQEPFRPITLEEGIVKMENLLSSEEEVPGNKTIPLYYIQRRAVSSDGKAEQWIFGVKADNLSYFVQVESNRQVLIPWSNELPGKEIRLPAVIPPGDLITRNGPLIARTFNKPEASLIVGLELSGNIYAVTQESGAVYRILYFDASTGKVINQ